MPRATLPAQDRAGLSARAKDHQHELKTKFTRLDLLSLAVDVVFGMGVLVVLCGACALKAFGLPSPEFIPDALMGMPMYFALTWMVLTTMSVIGLAGLLRFWLWRIWMQTYGTRTRWTGMIGTQILLGAVMPLVCLMMLSGAGQLMTWQGGLFGVMALIYLRHAFQVYRWAFA